ncbi:hypothetical protein [Inquilinus limosus]|uniref:Uncharacterized protein n=1 Tax=Inquilinus limosus MP06 TaxID=1398085 RepID=A0A0A0DDR0_9PROT|nr:hypothetical protein [Inquilinus limosus]KGM36180.1 hypothetical protein P409_00600 [Inquilinus limosus MP06]
MTRSLSSISQLMYKAGIDLEAFYMFAIALGVSEDRAERFLEEEVKVVQQNPHLRYEDAVEKARKRVLELATRHST